MAKTKYTTFKGAMKDDKPLTRAQIEAMKKQGNQQKPSNGGKKK